MYGNALEFLEEERDAWRPYEALAELPDAALERETDPEGPGLGWSGRVLAGHMLAWLEHALAVARELAVGTATPTRDAMRADWDARGDAVNDDLMARWAALPLDEVRRRLRDVPGELRGSLTVVPETRWIKDPDVSGFFFSETIEHYEEHMPQLRAVLEAASAAS
ncbi:MAG TPA: hypothetical protein VFK38_04890 [Candidatus Limnocylindrales bacterium]|nr:hypothetical protein [Candidatus Limnocylindrales bacterium]